MIPQSKCQLFLKLRQLGLGSFKRMSSLGTLRFRGLPATCGGSSSSSKSAEAAAPDAETLPLRVLETQVTGTGESVFIELTYSIETSEPERICVDYISSQKAPRHGSAVTEHTESLQAALETLRERIAVIHEFLKAVRAGRCAAPRPALMRRIARLCNMLPVGSNASFQEALLREANDGLLVSYLAEITKVAVAVTNTEQKVRLGASESKVDRVSAFAVGRVGRNNRGGGLLQADDDDMMDLDGFGDSRGYDNAGAGGRFGGVERRGAGRMAGGGGGRRRG